MNSGICPAGSVESTLHSQNFLQRLLQNLLNGHPVRLNLPALVVGAVILNSELDVHGDGSQPWGHLSGLMQYDSGTLAITANSASHIRAISGYGERTTVV